MHKNSFARVEVIKATSFEYAYCWAGSIFLIAVDGRSPSFVHCFMRQKAKRFHPHILFFTNKI